MIPIFTANNRSSSNLANLARADFQHLDEWLLLRNFLRVLYTFFMQLVTTCNCVLYLLRIIITMGNPSGPRRSRRELHMPAPVAGPAAPPGAQISTVHVHAARAVLCRNCLCAAYFSSSNGCRVSAASTNQSGCFCFPHPTTSSPANTMHSISIQQPR